MNDLMEAAKLGAEKIGRSFGPDEDWVPALLVRTRDDEFLPIAIPPGGDESHAVRDALWQSVVPSLLVEAHAVEAVVVMSAWVSLGDPEKSESEQIAPSKNPDRRDVLVLFHVTQDAEDFVMAEVKRTPEGPAEIDWESDLGGVGEMRLGGRVVAGIRRGLAEA